MQKVTYTKADCGCYVDGARGIYATDAIVDFARDHGAKIGHDAEAFESGECVHAETCNESEFAGCEWAGDYEAEADSFMEENHAVDGAYWGRNENGDWGLWEYEDND